MEHISLYQLNTRIKEGLKKIFPSSVWVVAEIADIREHSSGHCYLELIEKDSSDRTIASTRATIWANTYRQIKDIFESVVERRLVAGMKILVAVDINYHEQYGFALNIKNIDPKYTLGDVLQRKQEILKRLTKDGVINMNKELCLSKIPKNIAVISSPTAAGLEDFIRQIEYNQYGYKFHLKLYPTIMQGENTTQSLINSLELIYKNENLFDAVVIIRGGGSKTDLASFDSYEIGSNIAQFPLPIIVGIGHERDDTIADLVAYEKLKTPTAVAEFLISTFHTADIELSSLEEVLIEMVRSKMLNEKEHLRQLSEGITSLAAELINDNKYKLKECISEIKLNTKIRSLNEMARILQIENSLKVKSAKLLEGARIVLGSKQNRLLGAYYRKITVKKQRLELATTIAKHSDPMLILNRGFSITRVGGKLVNDAMVLKKGDIVETILKDGKFESEII